MNHKETVNYLRSILFQVLALLKAADLAMRNSPYKDIIRAIEVALEDTQLK